MLSPGDRIDRYEIVELLGSGGMGEVYRARDPRLERHIALKILRSDGALATGGRSRLLTEARAVAALSHVNVLAVHDAGEVIEPEHLRGLTYIAMELVVGKTLRALWLTYDAAFAQTDAEAKGALARGDDSAVPRRSYAHVNAEVGRVLLLAGRFADAASRLELAAFACRPITGDFASDTIRMVRAALDLGRAREGLGDIGGACRAYQRVLDRWGRATPRSVTADAASSARKRLSCAE